ncbi:hypothetical protein [Candidatus Xianfuyuplasma coldseepsis]|uniref:Uncharacterized protein n=1 Tax=Candidatus Xianfuyuplasma coldseepsis TaxID=2782163 RepID=A0A7L7KS68_9MOLU|nr:hypothetical protein [Xianfuyuplasma coldseepsis]QMS85102.1 hypothetical protein G4Z02_04875 [Xianfuyuplasma coldseepsis]
MLNKTDIEFLLMYKKKSLSESDLLKYSNWFSNTDISSIKEFVNEHLIAYNKNHQGIIENSSKYPDQKPDPNRTGYGRFVSKFEEEKHMIRDMFNKFNKSQIKGDYIVIDYEVPLMSYKNFGIGDIDLILDYKNIIYLVEAKAKRYGKSGPSDSLVSCAVQINNYATLVNQIRLRADFNIPNEKPIRKAIMIYKNTRAYRDLEKINSFPILKKFLQQQEISIFVMNTQSLFTNYKIVKEVIF